MFFCVFLCQAEDGIRDLVRSRGLGDVYKRQPKALFEPTKVLAGNQGLYNGFLAAGLIWSFLITNPEWQMNVRLFFLGCVAIAGLYLSLIHI